MVFMYWNAILHSTSRLQDISLENLEIFFQDSYSIIIWYLEYPAEMGGRISSFHIIAGSEWSPYYLAD